VFQILSLLMELHHGGVPDTYMALFPHLLAPVLWERPGNIPPLVRLIQAFIVQGAGQIEAEKLVSLDTVKSALLSVICLMRPVCV
jgi:exportin-2 (importin alpha re-exporter)